MLAPNLAEVRRAPGVRPGDDIDYTPKPASEESRAQAMKQQLLSNVAKMDRPDRVACKAIVKKIVELIAEGEAQQQSLGFTAYALAGFEIAEQQA